MTGFLSQSLPERTDESHEKPRSGQRIPGRESKQRLPEYKAGMLKTAM
jgi:hypothetical protein